MLPPDVLARLRCPACHGLLVARAAEPESIRCESCRRVFPVRDGIPVLIVGESLPPDAN